MKNILKIIIPIMILATSCSLNEEQDSKQGLNTFGDLSAKALFQKQLQLENDNIAYVQFESNSFGTNSKPKIVLGANIGSNVKEFSVNQYNVPKNKYGNFYQFIQTNQEEEIALKAPYTMALGDAKEVFEGGQEIQLLINNGTVKGGEPFVVKWESATEGEIVVVLKEQAVQDDGNVLEKQQVKFYVVENTGSFTVPAKDIASFADFTVSVASGEARTRGGNMYAIAYFNHSGTFKTSSK